MKDYKILLISFVLLVFMIGAVSASDLNSSDVAITSSDDSVDVKVDTKDIYVKDTGNDSNTGSAESPYASVARAYSDVNASNDATIHIGEGTYVLSGTVAHIVEDYGGGEIEEWDEEYNGLYINLDHNSFGGNLKFIGAGSDKTFLDGQSAFNFATVNTNSKVLIKDVTFINCKNNVGGTISNYGNLTVENCVFKDSYASEGVGGAIASGWDWPIDMDWPSLTVKNSQFINCKVNSLEGWMDAHGGGAIFVGQMKSHIENNTFINTGVSEEMGSGAAVLLWVSKGAKLINNAFINITGFTEDAGLNLGWESFEVDVINNTFINCTNPSDMYSIVNLGRAAVKLENNNFINSTNSVGNYYAMTSWIEKLSFQTDVTQINVSNDEINNGFSIPIKITDDNGNILKSNGEFNVLLSNEYNEYQLRCGLNDGILKATISEVPKNGIYNLSVLYNNYGNSQFNFRLVSDVISIVNVSASNDPVELYVSPKGSDADDGTIDHPFATIQHALDVGFENTFTIIVHLLEGTYSGDGNVKLTISDKGDVQILGEKYNKTIIDGNNSDWFMSVGLTKVFAENLTFINGNANKDLISGSNLYLKDCIVDNNSVNNARYSVMSDVSFDNLIFTNNKGSVSYGRIDGLVISNGYFANNDNSELNYGVLYIGAYSPVVENCTFINNTAKTSGAAIYPKYNLISRNNWYEGNSAPSMAVITMGTQFNFVFDNDTYVDNRATSGMFGVTGASPMRSDSELPTLNFINCKFINNSAVEGGAIGLKQGSLVNCSFINNSADYGGAIAIIPIGAFYGKSYEEITFDNVVFENNNAANGKDIYFDQTYSPMNGFKINFVSLTIDFNDLNVSKLVDTLSVNVTGPCGAAVDGGNIDLTLNGTKIGTANIVNGVATFEYSGFEEGTYAFSGSSDYANDNSTINKGTIIVKFEGVLDSVEYWVSVEGSDENGNGSEANPFKSISHAVVDASKICRNIIIHIGEGNFTGELNTALTLSAMNNITLIGQGVDKTVIDGENITYFAKVTDGNNTIVIRDLTVKNILPDNRQTKVIDSESPITIGEGATLILNNVELSDNHGGDAIIVNNGNLIIDNAVITRNGLSTNGLIYGGNVTIENSSIFDNYAYSSYMFKGMISGESIVVNNTNFKGNYISFNGLSSNGFVLIQVNRLDNDAVIENTNISSGGNNESLKLLGVDESVRFNPALTVAGKLNMSNVNMIYDFNGTIYTQESSSQLTYPSAINSYGPITSELNVYNSSFRNFRYVWLNNGMIDFKYNFDSCVFENMTYLAHTRTNGEGSEYNISNSVFLFDGDIIFNQKRFADINVPKVNFNNNYWGNNSKPTVYFLGNRGIKDETYSPETWIVLTSEDEQTVIKNLTDGENITAYTGNAPIRTDYADNDGALDYAVVFGPVGYLFTTDDDKNVIFNPEDAMYPFVAADPMDYRTPSVITITGFAGDLGIVGVLVDPVGNPIANATISSIIDGVNVANVTTDDNGTFTVKGIKNGVLTILFNGTVDYFDAEYNLTFADAGKTTKSFINLDAIESDLAVKGRLVDDEGNPIANATITYTLNGENATNVTTDADGVFQVQAASDAVVDIVFAGSEGADPVNTSLTIKGLATLRSATVIEGNNFTQNAIEYGAGERGGNFTVQLKDANGNVLANKTVLIGYNGKTLERVTNATGHASVQINLKDENRLTFAVAFLGDEDYNATMSVYLITIAKKPVTMTATAKSFKAAAKSKKYSVTLKTVKGASADGKTYFAAGKVVKLSVNGKTYTAKTNAKGQATFNLKLTKKGKFTAKVSYAGDKTYNAVSKSVKLTIN